MGRPSGFKPQSPWFASRSEQFFFNRYFIVKLFNLVIRLHFDLKEIISRKRPQFQIINLYHDLALVQSGVENL